MLVLRQTNLFGFGASQRLTQSALPTHRTRKVRLDQTL